MRGVIFVVMEMIKGNWVYCSRKCFNDDALFIDLPLLVDNSRGEVVETNDDLWRRGYREVTCDYCGEVFRIKEPYYKFEDDRW